MKIFIDTVGCPKNHEDSERMAGGLAAAGHEIVFTPEEADAIVVNTCGFIEDAKRESIETIFSYVPYKAQPVIPANAGISPRPRKLIVTGCLSQRYADELKAELAEADLILGVDAAEKLPGLIDGIDPCHPGLDPCHPGLDPCHPGLDPCHPGLDPGSTAPPRYALSSRYTSTLKVAEGCSNSCAYCVIPRIRGPYRSVPMEDILEEAATLAREGARELVLIAQDVTCYGKELYGEYRLPELLRRLCQDDMLTDVQWIRLLYCYEERITDELTRVMQAEPKLLHYIDIPLQHVSADILKRMNRFSTPESIRDTIARLRAAMPDIVIRTTFITGLPGETEEDFEALMEFCEETKFDRLGVFAYSREEGTAAAAMPDQVDPALAEERKDALMRLQMDISLEANARLVGTVVCVIVDGTEDDYFIGRTKGDAPEIDNAVMFTVPGSAPAPTPGDFVRIRITDAMDYDLVGEMIS
ncbi:MAG: 30S ribosomal protein S12 methylthiotransferase RimO [Clostridiales Family XIII bacterium]|jgi:ribosomal protein S12 methylthiotransferase|nr:30S ribosomal protein S12 methylthiotransferase RimO [Clostridiales Family XIII bacterium]